VPEQDRVDSEDATQRRWGTAEAWLIGIGAGLVVVALMGATYSIGYHHGKNSAEPAAAPASGKAPPGPSAAATGPGRELFAKTCGSCHTLAEAETSGTVGPNLDELSPDAATVEAAIENGGAGSGTMPPNLYTGEQAKQVAAYVAAAAGAE
jgi:mono/diheme cytochrome c family protein